MQKGNISRMIKGQTIFEENPSTDLDQPFGYPRSDPSAALRTGARGMPFDKLKALSPIEGLSRTVWSLRSIKRTGWI
jgi:hypothetical protein